MRFGTIHDEPALRALTAFDGSRSSLVPRARLEEVRARARAFRSAFSEGPRARSFRTCELVRAPYPTRYAFHACYTETIAVQPLIHVVNRLAVIQVDTRVGRKVVLFSPSDVHASARTRFFRRIGGPRLQKILGAQRSYGRPRRMDAVKAAAQQMLAPVTGSVEEWLHRMGLLPRDVDYIVYDHLHGQDLRGWLGTDDRHGSEPPLFPNAKLLVTRREWESARAVLAPHSDWYCPNGTRGIPPSRVVLVDGGVFVGDGLAFVETPGHTMGHWSMVVNTDRGILVSSENGVSADAYAPMASSMRAVRAYAKATGAEVVLNGNTQESGVDQYLSMVLEKEIAGPNREDPRFANVIPSCEFASFVLFGGLKPTLFWGDVQSGLLAVPERALRSVRRTAPPPSIHPAA